MFPSARPPHQLKTVCTQSSAGVVGEYDVPKCSPTTPAEDCVHEITAHFQVKDMMRECPLRKDPSCWGNTTGYEGINLIYAAGHCHAPSCISMELYNADTA